MRDDTDVVQILSIIRKERKCGIAPSYIHVCIYLPPPRRASDCGDRCVKRRGESKLSQQSAPQNEMFEARPGKITRSKPQMDRKHQGPMDGFCSWGIFSTDGGWWRMEDNHREMCGSKDFPLSVSHRYIYLPTSKAGQSQSEKSEGGGVKHFAERDTRTTDTQPNLKEDQRIGSAVRI